MGDANIMLPIDRMIPTKILSQVPVKHPGIFFPVGFPEEPLLAFNWGDESRLMTLDGKFPFRFFRQQIGHSLQGLLVKDVEFLGDPASRYDSSREIDPLGALVLSEGKAFVIGINSGNNFGDPQPVPLWLELGGASAEVSIGFERWKIVTYLGDDQTTIWSTPQNSENQIG